MWHVGGFEKRRDERRTKTSSPTSACTAFRVSGGRIKAAVKAAAAQRPGLSKHRFTSSPFRLPVNGPATSKASHCPFCFHLGGTHGPTKDQSPAERAAACSGCGARGLPSLAFSSTPKPARTRRLLFPPTPPNTPLFVRQDKKRGKSETSSIRLRSMRRSFSSPPFLRLPSGPAPPPPHSDVGHFTFISSPTPIVLNVIWKKEVKEATPKKRRQRNID